MSALLRYRQPGDCRPDDTDKVDKLVETTPGRSNPAYFAAGFAVLKRRNSALQALTPAQRQILFASSPEEMRKGSAKVAFASIVKVWAAERATALKRISARKGAKGRRKKREKDKDEGYGRPRDKRTTYAMEKARNTESKRRSRAKRPPMNAFDKLYLDVVAATQQVEEIRGEFQRANNLVDQGVLYRSQGRYKDSTAMANESAAMLSEAYRNLQIFRQQSRRISRRGIWWRGDQPKEDHPDIATGLHNLAAVYASSTTWHDKAESMHVEALAMRRRVHFVFRGPGGGTRDEIDHPDIAQSLSDLADLYEKQGPRSRERERWPGYRGAVYSNGYDEAKLLYVKALAMRWRLHGAERVAGSKHCGQPPSWTGAWIGFLHLGLQLVAPDHPDIVTSLNSLAGLYKTQRLCVYDPLPDRWPTDEAELLYVEALKMNRRMHGAEKDHPDIATSLNNLARLYVSKGRQRATLHLKVALEHLDAKAIADADPSHKATVDAYAAYVGSDAYKAAVDFANKAVADDSGGGLSRLAAAKSSRAACHAFLRVTRPSSVVSPWCSPAIASQPAREVFTDNWDNWDNDAWDNWDHAVSIINAGWGAGDVISATYDALLSVFYDKAEPLYVEALAMWRRVHGAKKDHPDIVASLAGRDIACKNLAGLYMAQRRYDEAEPLYVEAMEITRRVRGAEKAQSDTAQSLNNIAKRRMTGGRGGATSSAAVVHRPLHIGARSAELGGGESKESDIDGDSPHATTTSGDVESSSSPTSNPLQQAAMQAAMQAMQQAPVCGGGGGGAGLTLGEYNEPDTVADLPPPPPPNLDEENIDEENRSSSDDDDEGSSSSYEMDEFDQMYALADPEVAVKGRARPKQSSADRVEEGYDAYAMCFY